MRAIPAWASAAAAAASARVSSVLPAAAAASASARLRESSGIGSLGAKVATTVSPPVTGSPGSSSIRRTVPATGAATV